jgi:hypothetical protein
MRWPWIKKSDMEKSHSQEIGALEVESDRVLFNARVLSRELHALALTQLALVSANRRYHNRGHRPERRRI